MTRSRTWKSDQELAWSDTPFDRWYRHRVRELYGVDLRQAVAFNEVLADWHAPYDEEVAMTDTTSGTDEQAANH